MQAGEAAEEENSSAIMSLNNGGYGESQPGEISAERLSGEALSENSAENKAVSLKRGATYRSLASWPKIVKTKLSVSI